MAETLTVDTTPDSEVLTADEQDSLQVGEKMAEAEQQLLAGKYENAEQGIFTLDEWHDSFVFDAVRKQFNLNELNWSSGIIKGEGHPLINSDWGAYLDHLKGARKDTGKSHAKDLKIRRTESYWTN